ncbi:hypothetical protein U3A59_09030 [Algoriphagus sp. E1-3-M2]|nr:hypothetical protein [Algoriphagus sp. E1-3-M2]
MRGVLGGIVQFVQMSYPSLVENTVWIRVGMILTIYALVIVMISWNTYRINKGVPVKYFPKINFLR